MIKIRRRSGNKTNVLCGFKFILSFVLTGVKSRYHRTKITTAQKRGVCIFKKINSKNKCLLCDSLKLYTVSIFIFKCKRNIRKKKVVSFLIDANESTRPMVICQKRIGIVKRGCNNKIKEEKESCENHARYRQLIIPTKSYKNSHCFPRIL